jgi:hypothetical protein
MGLLLLHIFSAYFSFRTHNKGSLEEMRIGNGENDEMR